jgi:hypothetical protein
MYQQRMMLPCAHQGYEGDSAIAGAAVLRDIPTPNIADVMVAGRTGYLKVMDCFVCMMLRLTDMCVSSRHYQLDLRLMRRSAPVVAVDCICREGSFVAQDYSRIPSQALLIKTLFGIEALTTDHSE